MALKEIDLKMDMNSMELEYDPTTDSCEHGNDPHLVDHVNGVRPCL
jgi:hypothetical protein